MLKLQVALVAILITCVAFVSCNRMQKMLDPAADAPMGAEEMMAADDMTMDMMMDMMMDMTMDMDMPMHKSWAHVTLPEPVGTGTAHGTGARTVYFNAAGAMANKAGTMYPAGTMIVKEIMDETNAFVMTVARMMKSDDPMYAAHNGWMYVQVNRSDATTDFMPQAGDIPGGNSMGCHGCHAKAENDSVFVSLPMDEDMMDEDMMDEDMMDEDMMDEDMMDEDMMDEDMMDEDMMDEDMMDEDMMDEDMMDEDMMDEDMMDEDMMDEDMGDDGMDDGADAANGAGDAGNGAGDAQ